MKLFFMILTSMFFGSLASYANKLGVDGKITTNDFMSEHAKPTDFVPYPWGTELPFPWKNIQGMWMANVGNTQTYYTFEVVGQYSTDKQLMIKQYDAKTCGIISIGVGVESENKTIWAHMKPVFLPKAYRLGLRSFSADVLPKHLPNINGKVMVMSISLLESLKSNYYPMQKVNKLTMSSFAVQCKQVLR